MYPKYQMHTVRTNTKAWGRNKKVGRCFFYFEAPKLRPDSKPEETPKEEKKLVGKITFTCPPEFYYEMNGEQYTNGETVEYYGDPFELKAYDKRFEECIIATRRSEDSTKIDYAIHKGIYKKLKEEE